MKRLIAIVVLALAIMGSGHARADSLCLVGGFDYPMPGHGPTHVSLGPYCVPIP